MFYRTISVSLFFMFLLAAPVYAFAAGPTLLPAPDSSGKWGYVDAASGKVVVEPRYARAGMFHHGFAVVHMAFPQASYSVWSLSGEQVDVLPQGDGLIDASGNEVLPAMDGQFVTPASPASELHKSEPAILPGLYEVRGFGGRGVIDMQSGWVLEIGQNENIRFMADGSFVFNGSTYISAAPERNIYLAPDGYLIADVDLASRTFLLEDAERAESRRNSIENKGFVGVAHWTGELLNKTPYAALARHGQCGRWSGVTLGGRLDLFDDSGEVIHTIATDLSPRLLGDVAIQLRRGMDYFVFDPCGLKEIPSVEYTQLPRDSGPEPEFRVELRSGLALLVDRWGNELIPPRYEMLLPAGYGYWWGRYDGVKWVLIDVKSGLEIRIPETE